MKYQKYDKYFYATICPVCLQRPVCENGLSVLKTCSGCGLVSYCSVDHQKRHWPYHKCFCQALRRILAKLNASSLYSSSRTVLHFKEWNAIRFNIHLLCQLELNRKLTVSETQMLLFPRVCNVCYAHQSKLLKDCRLCLSVSYCSVEHEEQDRGRHAKDCAALKLCFDLDVTHDVNCYVEGGVATSFGFITSTDRAKVLFKLHSSSFLLKSNIHTLCEISESDLLSCPMTIVYVAYKSLCNISNSLNIEIVGAAEFETSNLAKWEHLLHWFPQVSHIHLSFIGLELREDSAQNIQLCGICISKKVQITVELYSNTLYSSFVKVRKGTKPDLIFAFNCGFGEFYESSNDTWSESIPFMLQNGCPVTITSYNLQEAEHDLQCLKHVCRDVSVSVVCEKNLFGSQRPHRDWEAHDIDTSSQVFYKNNFFSVVI